MHALPTFHSMEDAYLATLRQAMEGPEHHISARGNDAREVIGVGFRLSNPRQRFVYLKARRANPAFSYAEALWHLTGRRDVEMIGYYAPSIRAHSTDGVTLPGSSHGDKLVNPAPGDSISPFERVLELLRTETDSKRGYLPVFAASELAVGDNRDMACAAGLHLLARDGRLHLVCNMRANDLYRGLVADVFTFTMFQEYAAVQLGLELGSYTHFIGSAHVNDRDAERVKTMLNEADVRPGPLQFPAFALPKTTGPATLARLLEHEELLRTNRASYSAEFIEGLDLEPYWKQTVLLFEIYRQIRHEKPDAVNPQILAALEPGLRWLTAARWASCTAVGGKR